MVAGLVAAEANNDQCIVGIAYNCTILGRQVKDIPEKTTTTDTDITNFFNVIRKISHTYVCNVNRGIYFFHYKKN